MPEGPSSNDKCQAAAWADICTAPLLSFECRVAAVLSYHGNTGRDAQLPDNGIDALSPLAQTDGREIMSEMTIETHRHRDGDICGPFCGGTIMILGRDRARQATEYYYL